MKFAVAHNIPAFGQIKKQPIQQHPAKLVAGGLKVQGHINEAMLFVF
jgi:hypothetical protein